MKTIVALFLLSSVAIAAPLKNSDLRPDIEQPLIPGTKVPVEELNTAPTSPELQEDDRAYRNTLKARKPKSKKKKNK